MFLGNGVGNGKIYQLSATQFSDDGAAIDSYYTTYFFLSNDLEQQYQVRSHRKLFAYLTLYAEGAGNLNLSGFVDNEAFPTALPPLPLSIPGTKGISRCRSICSASVLHFRWGRIRRELGLGSIDLFLRCCRIRGRRCEEGISA